LATKTRAKAGEVLATKKTAKAMLLRLEFEICLSTGAECYICRLDNSPPSKMTRPLTMNFA